SLAPLCSLELIATSLACDPQSNLIARFEIAVNRPSALRKRSGTATDALRFERWNPRLTDTTRSRRDAYAEARRDTGLLGGRRGARRRRGRRGGHDDEPERGGRSHDVLDRAGGCSVGRELELVGARRDRSRHDLHERDLDVEAADGRLQPERSRIVGRV